MGIRYHEPPSPRARSFFARQAAEARKRDDPADLRRRVNLEPHERSGGALTAAAHGPHRVRMLQHWQGYEAGEEVGFNASIARQLIDLGVAERAAEPVCRLLCDIRDALTGQGC